jgi:hypothetical protein
VLSRFVSLEVSFSKILLYNVLSMLVWVFSNAFKMHWHNVHNRSPVEEKGEGEEEGDAAIARGRGGMTRAQRRRVALAREGEEKDVERGYGTKSRKNTRVLYRLYK